MHTAEKLLGEELYKKVREKLGNDRGLIIDDGMLIPKHRFDCINVSLREHKKLVSELREENLQLKEKLAELEEKKLENAKIKREMRITELILASKPKNFNAVRSNIDAGKATGRTLDTLVTKKLKQLKKTDPYLFYGEQTYRLVPVGDPAETEIKQ